MPETSDKPQLDPGDFSDDTWKRHQEGTSAQHGLFGLELQGIPPEEAAKIIGQVQEGECEAALRKFYEWAGEADITLAELLRRMGLIP